MKEVKKRWKPNSEGWKPKKALELLKSILISILIFPAIIVALIKYGPQKILTAIVTFLLIIIAANTLVGWIRNYNKKKDELISAFTIDLKIKIIKSIAIVCYSSFCTVLIYHIWPKIEPGLTNHFAWFMFYLMLQIYGIQITVKNW